MNWYENDELWDGFGGMMFSTKRAANTSRTVSQAPLMQFPAQSRILDLCCGPGLYLVPLAKRGHVMTGVDLSSPMVAKAREACAHAGVAAEIVEGDMLDFVRPAAFDVVVSMFSSFGYFDDHNDNVRVLTNVYDSLAPGGQFVLEVFGKEFLASRDLSRPQVVDLDGETVFVRNTVHDDWSRLHTEWTKVRGNMVSTAVIDSRLYSAVELKQMLRSVGFVDVECFGDVDGRPYGLRSKTLLARSAKP